MDTVVKRFVLLGCILLFSSGLALLVMSALWVHWQSSVANPASAVAPADIVWVQKLIMPAICGALSGLILLVVAGISWLVSLGYKREGEDAGRP
jgi:hypothetical protein